jgi:hypothetical protein
MDAVATETGHALPGFSLALRPHRHTHGFAPPQQAFEKIEDLRHGRKDFVVEENTDGFVLIENKFLFACSRGLGPMEIQPPANQLTGPSLHRKEGCQPSSEEMSSRCSRNGMKWLRMRAKLSAHCRRGSGICRMADHQLKSVDPSTNLASCLSVEQLCDLARHPVITSRPLRDAETSRSSTRET